MSEINNTPENEITVRYRLKQFDIFEALWINRDFSDVTVLCEGKSFKLHKNILSTGSDFFNAMFKNDMKENRENKVEISDVKYEILYEVFHFIYTGKVEEIKKIAQELFYAAEYFQVKNLKALCEEIMSNSLNDDNVIKYFELATKNNAEILRKKSLTWVVFNIEKFIDKPEFEEIVLQNPKVSMEIMKNLVRNEETFKQPSMYDLRSDIEDYDDGW